MLAAIIQNLQNQPQPEAPLPTVHVDRGGGGPSWPRYEIADIIGAIAAFQEIPGEHPVARAVRRHRWIGDALPRIKEAREKRETAAFLVGAQLGAAAEREAALEATQTVTRTMAESREVDVPRAQPLVPLPRGRRDSSSSPGGATLMIGLVIGVVLGATIVGRHRRKR